MAEIKFHNIKAFCHFFFSTRPERDYPLGTTGTVPMAYAKKLAYKAVYVAYEFK